MNEERAQQGTTWKDPRIALAVVPALGAVAGAAAKMESTWRGTGAPTATALLGVALIGLGVLLIKRQPRSSPIILPPGASGSSSHRGRLSRAVLLIGIGSTIVGAIWLGVALWAPSVSNSAAAHGPVDADWPEAGRGDSRLYAGGDGAPQREFDAPLPAEFAAESADHGQPEAGAVALAEPRDAAQVPQSAPDSRPVDSSGPRVADSMTEKIRWMGPLRGEYHDPVSALWWQQPPAEAHASWREARAYCMQLSGGGGQVGEWRLPTVRELCSLTRWCNRGLDCEHTCPERGSPTIDGCWWPDELSSRGEGCGWFWSSDDEPHTNGGQARVLFFDTAGVGSRDKRLGEVSTDVGVLSTGGRTRCVRGSMLEPATP